MKRQITAKATAEFNLSQNQRLAEIMQSLIRHVHAFADEVQLTELEWFTGIDFLTRTGQLCDMSRQEFILLSDILGLSMLVDEINHASEGSATDTTVYGPFYREGAPARAFGDSIAIEDKGEAVLWRGRVLTTEGEPVPNALLDVWQTASNSLYENVDPEQPEFNMRGKFTASDQGEFAFISSRPVTYAVPSDGTVGELLDAAGRHPNRPSHVHFMLSAEGFQKLNTQLFPAHDPYLDSDAVFAVKPSLIVPFTECRDRSLGQQFGLSVPFYVAEFDFVLETESRGKPWD